MPLLLDSYNPFDSNPTTPQSQSESFLPSKGLFSPTTRTATPNFCATILEEDDLDSDQDEEPTVMTPRDTTARVSCFTIHPRILRAGSCSDDDASDSPAVLRFPVPPSSIPTPPKQPPSPTRTSSPRRAPLCTTKPQLKSIWDEEEDDSDATITPTPIPSRLPSPLSLFKRATNAFVRTSRTPSPPTVSSSPKSKTERSLPRIPSRSSTLDRANSPYSTSPTPSLSSSSSSLTHSDETASTTTPYIPVGSIIPQPAIVQDIDDYLETLEMYFPPELWEEPPTISYPRRSSSRRSLSRSNSRSSVKRKTSNEDVKHLRSTSSSSSLASPNRTIRISEQPSPSTSRTPSPPVVQPRGILKPSKSTPHLRVRSCSDSRLAPPVLNIPPPPAPPPPSAFRQTNPISMTRAEAEMCFSPLPPMKKTATTTGMSRPTRGTAISMQQVLVQ
ncbi:hypothetical protein FRB99_006262 [Tulasnella sp. 403]|nr:hypothetical protein FRB99_006262 [Tulasnella sp. 403]